VAVELDIHKSRNAEGGTRNSTTAHVA